MQKINQEIINTTFARICFFVRPNVCSVAFLFYSLIRIILYLQKMFNFLNIRAFSYRKNIVICIITGYPPRIKSVMQKSPNLPLGEVRTFKTIYINFVIR